jgi:hypothetical protein
MRGKEVKSWSNQTSINIILPYNNESGGKAVPEPLLEKEYPNTYSFFVQFKDELLGRSHYKKHFEAQSAPFYSTYNVGSYTFSDYKVVWKYISTFLECSIIGKQNTEILGTKVIIPDTKLVLIDFTTFEEANYCCAILNSCLSKFVVKAYVVETQLAPHILKSIRIPKYQTEVTIHTELSKLSHQCHEKTAAGIDVTDLEEQIDELAAELWGLTNEELRDIKESLEELR